jgi:hypothetical protein
MDGFKGAALPMTAEDVASVAEEIGVEVAALKAVLAVESAGAGFDKSGRPKALFERHHFFKHLKAKPVELDQAVSAGLAYPKWGEKPYPKGSDAVYAEIAAAYDIDADAALLSTSWGLGQVMGSNFKMIGCESVAEMLAQAMHSEGQQLRHMANFCKSAGLINAMKNKDWAAFAKGYNGPQYAKNQYDIKLANAYQKAIG